MKKLLILCLLLFGCQSKSMYHLYIYYAQTCPICQSLIKNVVPMLEEKYSDTMEIVTYNIDQEESIEYYAKTCSLLEGYQYTDDSGSVPFLVLDGYFAKVGYELGTAQDIVDAIDDAINGREIDENLQEVYYFKDGQSFYEGG